MDFRYTRLTLLEIIKNIPDNSKQFSSNAI